MCLTRDTQKGYSDQHSSGKVLVAGHSPSLNQVDVPGDFSPLVVSLELIYIEVVLFPFAPKNVASLAIIIMHGHNYPF